MGMQRNAAVAHIRQYEGKKYEVKKGCNQKDLLQGGCGPHVGDQGWPEAWLPGRIELMTTKRFESRGGGKGTNLVWAV